MGGVFLAAERAYRKPFVRRRASVRSRSAALPRFGVSGTGDD